MTSHVIEFSPEGTVQAMHNDGLSLSFLGAQTIERASEIKFNEKTQKWGIWLANTPLGIAAGLSFLPPVRHADGFGTYDGARRVEVAWLNQCRYNSVEPESAEGLVLLKASRDVLLP